MVRRKQRYVLAEIVYDDNRYVYPVNQSSLYGEILSAFKEAFGEYGLALVKGSLSVRYVNDETKMFLVRIRRGAERMLSNSLLTIKTIGSQPAKVVTKHVSGSIRCAQKFWIKYNRRLLSETIKNCQDPEERQKLVAAIREIKNTDFTSMFKRYGVSNRFLKYKDSDASATQETMKVDRLDGT